MIRPNLPLACVALAASATFSTGAWAQLEAVRVTGTVSKVGSVSLYDARSTSAVSAQQMQDAGVTKLDEALRGEAGVLSQPYGSDNGNDWFKVRGFDAVNYQDGIRQIKDGYYWASTEPWGLEAVELIRGPSSSLYGDASPGGIINSVSKRPTRKPLTQAFVSLASPLGLSAGVDVSRAWQNDADVRYRVVGLVSRRDGSVDRSAMNRFYLAPSLALQLSPQTQLTLLASAQRDSGQRTSGFLPAEGTLVPAAGGTIRPGTNLGEPGYDRLSRDQFSLGYELTHQFSPATTLVQNARVQAQSLFLRSSYAGFGLASDGASVDRGLVFRDGTAYSAIVDTRLLHRWSWGGVKNQSLVGVESQANRIQGLSQDLFSGFGQPISIFSPVYGNYTPIDPALNKRSQDRSGRLGVYAQNQSQWGPWRAALGVRHDWVRTLQRDLSQGSSQSYSQQQTSWSGSLMYLADSGLAPYAQFSQSFQPLLVTGDAGQFYRPVIGQQTELGLKYRFEAGKTALALFDITEKNPLITVGGASQKQGADSRVRGLEWSGDVRLNSALAASASFTWTDAQRDGARAPLIPRQAATLGLDYTVAGGALAGLRLQPSLRYVGASTGSVSVGGQFGTAQVPSYTVIDVAAQYPITSRWTGQLNVSNLANRQYVSACDYFCYYGQERTVSVQANYRF